MLFEERLSAEQPQAPIAFELRFVEELICGGFVREERSFPPAQPGERLDVERTDGRRITVHGTDSYLHTFFSADSPDSVRHTLEGERRFYAGADLPRRRAGSQGTIRGSQPVVDLRSGEGAAVRSGAGSVT